MDFFELIFDLILFRSLWSDDDDRPPIWVWVVIILILIVVITVVGNWFRWW